MSLDFSLITPEICPHCGKPLRIAEQVFFSENMTHNVVPMWSKAGVFDALYNSDGRRAKEFLEILKVGLEDFKAHFQDYETLNSPNGWGLAKNALPFLQDVYDACVRYPDAVISISK